MRRFLLTIGGLSGGFAPPTAVYGEVIRRAGGLLERFNLSRCKFRKPRHRSSAKKKAHSPCVREHVNTAGCFCFEKRPARNLDPKTANFASTTKKRHMPAPPPSVAIEPLTSLHCTAEVIPPEAEVTRRSFSARGGGFFAGEGSAGPDQGFWPLNLRLRRSLVERRASGDAACF